MDVHTIDLIIGAVGSLPFLAIAGYVLWLEYKRAAIWGIYIGWLTVPAENYGWEISMVAHLRAATAFLDHDTAALVRQLT